MISAILTVLGIVIGIGVVICLFTVGFAGGVMTLVKWVVGQCREIFAKKK